MRWAAVVGLVVATGAAARADKHIDDAAAFDHVTSGITSPNDAFAAAIPGNVTEEAVNGVSGRWSFGNGVVRARIEIEELLATDAATPAETTTRLAAATAAAKLAGWQPGKPSASAAPYGIGGAVHARTVERWTPMYVGYWVSANRTIQRAVVSVDEIGARSPLLWRGVGERIFKSARAVKSLLAVGPVEALVFPHVIAALPAGWVGVHEPSTSSIDFLAHALRAVGDAGPWCRLRFDVTVKPEVGGEVVRGKVLRRDVEWHVTGSATDVHARAGAVDVHARAAPDGTTAAFECWGPTRADADAARAIVETLRAD